MLSFALLYSSAALCCAMLCCIIRVCTILPCNTVPSRDCNHQATTHTRPNSQARVQDNAASPDVTHLAIPLFHGAAGNDVWLDVATPRVLSTLPDAINVLEEAVSLAEAAELATGDTLPTV